MQKEETAFTQFRPLGNGYKMNQDALSVDEICSGTWKEVYRFIYYRVGNREEAEDITQETYAKALEFLQREQIKIDNYSNFFKTVAVNIIRDQWRHQWRQKKRRGVRIDLEDIKNMEVLTTEDFTESSAKREMVEAAMNSLNPEQHRGN